MKQNDKLQLNGLYFVLPTVVIYGLFLFYPMVSAFQHSFYKWNLVSEKKFVGLFNYLRLFSDKRFWNMNTKKNLGEISNYLATKL